MKKAVSRSRLKKQKHFEWHFPLKAHFPQFREKFLNNIIGANEHHSAKVRDGFVQKLFVSLSLSIHEKRRILDRYSSLSKFQLDELIKVFDTEYDKFLELEREHPEDIKKLTTTRAVDWIFVLEGDINDIDLILCDLLYSGEIDGITANLCLSRLYKYKKRKEFAVFFDNLLCNGETNIHDDHWNTYINILSDQKRYKDLQHLVFPEYVKSTSFLLACQASYLLRDNAFDFVNEEIHIANLLNFVRGVKDSEIRAQFIEDAASYYLYKNRDLKKYVQRIVNTFVMTSYDDFNVSFSLLVKYLTYLIPLYIFMDDELIRKILNHHYLYLNRWFDNFEDKKNNHHKVASFYLNENNNICSVASQFLVNSKTQKYFFQVLNRNEYLSSNIFSDLIFQIVNLKKEADNDKYLKNSIGYALDNDLLENVDIYNIYYYCHMNGKQKIASHMINEFKKNHYCGFEDNLRILTDPENKPEWHFLNKVFGKLEKYLDRNIERFKLNFDFDEYKTATEKEESEEVDQ